MPPLEVPPPKKYPNNISVCEKKRKRNKRGRAREKERKRERDPFEKKRARYLFGRYPFEREIYLVMMR